MRWFDPDTERSDIQEFVQWLGRFPVSQATWIRGAWPSEDDAVIEFGLRSGGNHRGIVVEVLEFGGTRAGLLGPTDTVEIPTGGGTAIRNAGIGVDQVEGESGWDRYPRPLHSVRFGFGICGIGLQPIASQ